MSVALTKGGNVSLNRQVPGVRSVRVCLGWTAGPGYDLDASALLCGASGKVLTDQHFVFFNNLQSPDGAVRHLGADGGGGEGEDRERIEVRLADVSADVQKVVFAVAIYDAARRRQTFGQVRGAYVRLTDADGGAEVARYDVTPETGSETAMVFGELYRNGADWKFRAIGQGYASGLAGIATDFGVDVLQPAPAAPSAPAPAPAPLPPMPAAAPAAVVPAVPKIQPATGSSPVTCFFDPTHGVGSAVVLWQPQWGVPRQVEACAACAQRVQTTVPPFYTPPQAGYPQQQVQPHVPAQQQDQGGRRFGTGAMLGAGAAGLVGGMLLNEALSDDEPRVVVNNYYEDDDDSFF
ncbi:TerD family protein [Kitasatospora aureofaciens]|uniref:TerD family protein n=1 Tax=Kitasatospora aureofaciens TaxID=1894 RepID=UPI000524BDF4|nr:TerD family protein [Kitasatospora aureofaciens]